MNKLIRGLFLLVSIATLSACASFPAGWSASCQLPSGSYTNQDGIVSMTLDGDEIDSCHRGKSLSKRKQRSEIKYPVLLNHKYSFEYEFKYSGAGGASILQLHPGSAGANHGGDIWYECSVFDFRAGFKRARLNIPGLAELYPISDEDYKDKWHRVKFTFRASNDDPLYIVEFDGKKVFDSSEHSGKVDLCYYPNQKPNLKIGLYRGKRSATESISYRDLKVTRLD